MVCINRNSSCMINLLLANDVMLLKLKKKNSLSPLSLPPPLYLPLSLFSLSLTISLFSLSPSHCHVVGNNSIDENEKSAMNQQILNDFLTILCFEIYAFEH